jgi:hypothetical protein
METSYDIFCGHYLKLVKQQYPLAPFGVGCSMPDKIHWIKFVFYSNEIVNIERTRELIVPLAQLMIDEINADTRLRPHLVHYLTTCMNITCGIIFETVKNEEAYES